MTARSVAYKARLGYKGVFENELVLFVPIIEELRASSAGPDTVGPAIYDKMIRLKHTFPVSLLSRFLIARSLRAQSARLHGPTFENNISLSRLFAAAPAISAPTLAMTCESVASSTSLEFTVSTPEGFSFATSAHACCTSFVSRGPASVEEIPMRENT